MGFSAFGHRRRKQSSFDQVRFNGHGFQFRSDIQKRFIGVVMNTPEKSMNVFEKRQPRVRSSTIGVEIVVDPVHFCCSAVEARAKTLNLMANLLPNARWHEPCSI